MKTKNKLKRKGNMVLSAFGVKNFAKRLEENDKNWLDALPNQIERE